MLPKDSMSSLPLVTTLLLAGIGLTPVRAGAPPATKPPEVSTVGTQPYTGPLPEELAKLAGLEAPSAPAAAEEKTPSVETVTVVPDAPLSPSELAKLAALLPTPALPIATPFEIPPGMETAKPDPMPDRSGGPAELTSEELAKRAAELAGQASGAKAGAR